ncbi:hypothetical protein I4F81_006052 [Pyropia yezoensis]|uniref:Uncharacterized protein n=1 Tax=Pyropia yezoensis TaxID=2788 RepID=A0ACC3C011_PYRYE|nr:hypothetical protein I4F81_006052 [Neopyropia yezoensis]
MMDNPHPKIVTAGVVGGGAAAYPPMARPSRPAAVAAAVAAAVGVAAVALLAATTSSGGARHGGGLPLAGRWASTAAGGDDAGALWASTDRGAAEAAAAAAANETADPATALLIKALKEARLAETPPLPGSPLFARKPGYFTLHLGTGLATGRMLLEIPRSSLGVPFMVTALIASGDAEENLAGIPGHTFGKNVFAWRLATGRPDALDLYRPLFDLRAEQGKGSPMAAALADGYFPGWVRTFGFRAAPGGGDALLIDATPWVSAGFDVLSDNDGRSPGEAWEQEHRLVGGAAYPRNVELDVQVRTRSGGTGAQPELSPERYWARVVHYSLVALPERPMEARPADARVGYFGTSYVSADALDGGTLKRTLINRWDLTRGPIRFYVDPTVPAQWRPAVRAGIVEWAKAFAAAGHPNAIQAVLPGDPDWPTDYSAGDARYSAIMWAPNLGAAYAMGPSEADPRTGEIFNGDIMIAANFVQAVAGGYTPELLAGEAGRSAAAAEAAEELREGADGVLMLAALQSADDDGADDGAGVPSVSRKVEGALAELVRQRFTTLVMHEVGHTLGLRHNFRASSVVPFAKLADPAYVAANGMSSSVMDYLPVLLREKPADQTYYFTPCIGAYDYAAIHYGYANFSSDAERLSFAQSVALNTPFATDNDVPGLEGADPMTTRRDLSSTPLDYFAESLTVALKVLRVGKATTARREGASWLEYGRVAEVAFRRATTAVSYATKFIGGTIPSRAASDGMAVGGGGGGHPPPPVSYVAAATQERALSMVTAALHPRTGLLGAEVAAEYGPFLVSRVCYQGDESPSAQCLGVAADATVSTLRTSRAAVLGALLHPARLARVTAGQIGGAAGGGARPPSVAQVLRRVTGALWANVGPPTDLQRDAQAQWVRLLLAEVDREEEGELVHHPLAVAAVAGELRHINGLAHGSGNGVLAGLAALTKEFRG